MTVTNALYEALIRYLNSIAGENPDDLKVVKTDSVKTAPTGKAAFNIKGNHYMLHLRYLPIKDLNTVHWIMTDLTQ